MYVVKITEKNDELAKLKLKWGLPAFTHENGIGPLDSLFQVSDAIVAFKGYVDDELKNFGSGVIIGPGMILTATHVLEEYISINESPIIFSFLPEDKARVWIPTAKVTCSGSSTYRLDEKIISDLSIVSCNLHSESYMEYPLSLIPLELSLPLPGSRLWAVGFRKGNVEDDRLLTPLVTSGVVLNCFPHGRGERMPSPCIEVDMEAYGGMSGGPVFNEDGRVIGIVSSSFDGGPTYVTLVWDAMRIPVNNLPDNIWPGKYSGILEGIDLGLVRVKGRFKADSKRNVTLTLSDEEMSYLT